MQKKRKFICSRATAILVVALTGCSKLGPLCEIHGSQIGNNYAVYTYDNYRIRP